MPDHIPGDPHRAAPDGLAGPQLRVITAHESAVLMEAAARLVPGPLDDPQEAGHPGAREADVVCFIDRMLSAFELPDLADRVPGIFAGGPWSNRFAVGPDPMAEFVPLSVPQYNAWQRRIAGWQRAYRRGVRLLDELAGGDFTGVGPEIQDQILASSDASHFTALLFGHTIESMYSVPEYGGNRNLVGWKDIGFPGDVQPCGYNAEEVECCDGPDPVPTSQIVTDVLGLLGGTESEVAEAVGAALRAARGPGEAWLPARRSSLVAEPAVRPRRWNSRGQAGT